MSELIRMFSYAFMQRALVVGLMVSVCAALIGVTLVLKRFSMIGDGLSHVGFGALSVGAAAGLAPMYIAVPAVLVAAALLLRMSRREERGRVSGDAATAVLSSTALAVGVIAASLGELNVDVSSYMFGSVLAVSATDAVICAVVCSAVLALYVLFSSTVFAVTFDETFAAAGGMKTGFVNTAFAAVAAVTVVVGMRLMGTLLISALTVFPAISAMKVCRAWRSTVICAAVFAASGFIIGLISAFMLSLPTGAAVVAADAVIYGVCAAVSRFIRRRA